LTIATKSTDDGREREMNRKIDPKLLEILICPLTKSTLRYDAEREELISDKARLAYPIHDGIPIMLPDEARPLDEDEAGLAGENLTSEEGAGEEEVGGQGSGKGGPVSRM
jgi:hypothetical protein